MGECVVASLSTTDGDACNGDLFVGADVLVREAGCGGAVVECDCVAGFNAR